MQDVLSVQYRGAFGLYKIMLKQTQVCTYVHGLRFFLQRDRERR